MQRLSAAECERRKKIQFHSIKIVWKSSDTSNFFSHNELHFVYAFVCVGVCTRVCLIFLRCLTRAINVFAYGKTFWNQKNSCAAAVVYFHSTSYERNCSQQKNLNAAVFSSRIPSTTTRRYTSSWITIVKVEFHQLKWQWLGKVFFISWLEKIFSNCNKIDGNSISQSVWICIHAFAVISLEFDSFSHLFVLCIVFLGFYFGSHGKLAFHRKWQWSWVVSFAEFANALNKIVQLNLSHNNYFRRLTQNDREKSCNLRNISVVFCMTKCFKNFRSKMFRLHSFARTLSPSLRFLLRWTRDSLGGFSRF